MPRMRFWGLLGVALILGLLITWVDSPPCQGKGSIFSFIIYNLTTEFYWDSKLSTGLIMTGLSLTGLT